MTKIAPMLATMGSELPAGDGWVYEPKYDGIRVLAFAEGRQVALVTRNGIDRAKQFPEIVDAVAALRAKVGHPFVIDGEVVAVRGAKTLRFQQLQRRAHVADDATINHHRGATPAALMVFDILLDGKTSVVDLPWTERHPHLEALFRKARTKSPVLRLTAYSTNGKALLAKATKQDWEGVIAKRTDQPYRMGKRTRAWLKVKLDKRQEFVIGGWTEPRNSREYFGALLLGYHDAHGKLAYAGHTGTGFTRQTLRDLNKLFKGLERKTSPFTTTPRSQTPTHWLEPTLVAEVKFNEWTGDGKLRQPAFLGLRDDKDAKDVVREPVTRRAKRKKAA